MTNTQTNEFDHIQACAICGSGGATITMIEHEFDFKAGNKMEVLSALVPVVECSECEEAYLAPGAEEIKHEAVCNFLGRLTPSAIVELRDQLGMSQAQLARTTGIGVASIKRWETGVVIQGAALDSQLRDLKRTAMADKQTVWIPRFQTVLSDAIRERARSFSLRPSGTRQLEAA
jgi:putative zinc finger/helix-turn-helix YgiT family protein